MAVQPHFLGSMTLKALLEDPNLKNPPIIAAQSSDTLKLKKEDDKSYPQYNYGNAFLGPNLWDRTVDNNTDFNLEYMDLDEFLMENGVAFGGEDANNSNSANSTNDGLQTGGLPGSPRQFLRTPPPLTNGPFKSVSPSYSPPITVTKLPSPTHVASGSKSPSPPVSPFNVDFQVSEQDLALASIPDYGEGSEYQPKWQVWTDQNGKKPGHRDFDPRKRNFTEEELKPQPIIKKSKKIFVPDGMKDDKYWARRHKNNFAAKRSRDARRVKENQIAMRAAFLEKENACLREEMTKLRKENAQLKGKVEKYEGTMPAVNDIVGLSL